MKLFFRIALPLMMLFPSFAFAQYVQTVTTGYSFGFVSYSGGIGGGCANGLACVGSEIIYIINRILVPVLFALAFIVFLWGVADAYIFSHGDPVAVAKGHKLILWGVLGFVVMVSLWGLVNVVANTFQLDGYRGPETPTSY